MRISDWSSDVCSSDLRRRAFCLALFSRAGFLFVSHDCGQKKMAAGKPTAICSLAELSSEAERHTCTIGARRTLILDRGTKAGVAVEHVGEPRRVREVLAPHGELDLRVTQREADLSVDQSIALHARSFVGDGNCLLLSRIACREVDRKSTRLNSSH